MKIEEYIEEEEQDLELSEERLTMLENKWFRKGGEKQETEFLKIFIKEKKKFIKAISQNRRGAK